jgi:hypothetical protein
LKPHEAPANGEHGKCESIFRNHPQNFRGDVVSILRSRRVETIEDQRDEVLCPGCPGDKPQIGESYRRAEVGN